MVVRTLLAVLFAALASMASAQTPIVPGMDQAASAFGPDQTIQITTTFRARVDGVADTRDVPTPIAQDTARRTLYNMAANECTLLAEYWKADCRLISFAVYLPLPNEPDMQPQAPSMFGTAVYALRLTSPGR